ncbi:alpha/beta fold hydrolase [Streptomyces similanensis]|uniref:AB hydrolase-1 domain-containing protein n=1 Tax=Streptomyces similanensis TaxID=1274988 RepID=A0ABP9JSJ5_9ACTN
MVATSLPGYGWSDKPSTTGWGITRTARGWDTLMVLLGYERYGAQGGDCGSAVSAVLGEAAPERVAGVHLNLGPIQGPRPQTLGYGLTDSPAGQGRLDRRGVLGHVAGAPALGELRQLPGP